ncbi:liprin-beta-1 isoform X3 [Plutella xylostella]|uniref:liprin-beta-1 isoform X3 n=1 Tax=Plutella xylostella TaxID=51655 RepID=UPI0020322377|nr:liprin-beta-1 isoform X3 [Plutella xylostella]
MRELSRGGSLVAATIAALHSRADLEPKSRPPPARRRRAERPLSTASEASERDSTSVQSSEDPPPRHSGDSDSPDEATLRCAGWKDGAPCVPARADSSDTASSSSSSEDDYAPGDDAHYRTLTPSRRLDGSTRRDDDFRWMPSADADDGGEPKSMENRTEEYSSASLDRRRRRTPSDRSDRDRKTRSSLSSKPPQHPASVRASPRPRRPRVEETPPDLQRRWNSYEHFRWPGPGGPGDGGWWPPVCWCHAPPPPCCPHDRSWTHHTPTPTHRNKNDAEDRVRRLESDKESLQLQVQVLSEQVSAQSDKMADLERALMDTRQRLDDAEQRLQKEMLQRSSLETQKLELLSKLSEMRLRVAERGVLERSPPPPDVATPLARPVAPRTPPANYGRQIERNTHMYSSLPRSSILTPEARLAFAEKEENNRGSPSPSLRSMARLERAPPRLSHTPQPQIPRQTTDVKLWDTEETCAWLESMGLEDYVPAARTWLNATPDARGVIAGANASTVERELGIKHPMHTKKIMLALADMQGTHNDPYLTAAGALDTGWVARWLEDVGVSGARGPALAARLDGRCLHRLAHSELHLHLRLHLALPALSVRRGIQVLRDNSFRPDTMIRRAADNGEDLSPSQIARWSSHRVMQWLKEIDLAEYAPNLRGAGVHGGLLLLEHRFTAELLAALLNIPANKTLLRRHLTQRFNDLLGRDVIQQKRNAEQTLGYQPLTATTKYKVPKKSQFSLKRKKSKDELDLSDLVCPLTEDCSGDANSTPTMKVKVASGVASAVSPPRDVTERAH